MSEHERSPLEVSAHDQFAAVLGDLLLRERRRCGMSRARVHDELGGEPSAQTLATYEYATRRLNVDRYVDLCRVYRADPGGLINEAVDKTVPQLSGDGLILDLETLAASPTPLSRWARHRLDSQSKPAATTIRLDPATLRRLETLCAGHPGLLDTIAEAAAAC